MSLRNVAVFSHRRSGTHLTIDTIRNNFAAYGDPPVNIDALRDPERAPEVRARLARRGASPAILKSHSPGRLEHHFTSRAALEAALQAVRDTRWIYVYRDGRDVLTSLYHYVRFVRDDLMSISFREFLKMKDVLSKRPSYQDLDSAEYWNHHVLSWAGREDVLYVSFESIVTDYERFVARLADFIEQPMPAQIRSVVRRAGGAPRSRWTSLSLVREKMFKLHQEYMRGLQYSSVHFRSGRSGAHEGLFDARGLEYFDTRASDAMELLGYYSKAPRP